MKILTKLIIILLICLAALINTSLTKKYKKKNNKSKLTPQGFDLRNHYGAERLNSPYGPRDDQIKLHVERNAEEFFPMTNIHNREKLLKANNYPTPSHYTGMNPSPLKAGKYTNIAPGAVHEINPEITGPKLHVSGDYEYPINAKVPTFLGMTNESKHVYAFDKLTGEIIDDNVLVRYPKMGYENRVVNGRRQFNHHYDMRTGEKITVDPERKFHGIDTAPEWHITQEVDECSSDTS
jgi:hypothetical protein